MAPMDGATWKRSSRKSDSSPERASQRPLRATTSTELPVPLWRAIVLMTLALMIGLGLGYVRWGREARRLREAPALASDARQQPAGEARRATARGVVRILLRDQAIVFLTHETIAGHLPGATRAFPVASPKLL